MKPEELRALTNHFLDFRLVSLKSWGLAKDFPNRDAGGPYVIAQEGYAPDDLAMRAREFLLGRSGKWLAVEILLKLPTELRRAEFVFETASEAMQLIQSLPTKAAVWLMAPVAEGNPASDADGFEAVFRSADRTTLSE